MNTLVHSIMHSTAAILIFVLSGLTNTLANENIQKAIELGEADKLRALLENGLDPNTILSTGNPALFTAIKEKQEVLVQMLIEYGADVNAVRLSDDSRTALLHLAATRGNSTNVKHLLTGEANVDPKNNRGFTPLIIAASRYDLDIVKLLIDKGADINAATNSGTTPLVAALNHPKGRDVVLLLESLNANFDSATYAKKNCDECHSELGVGITAVGYGAHLAGQKSTYLVKQLTDFREGYRTNRRMTNSVRSLSDKVIKELAGYYSQASPISRERIVNSPTDTTKLSHGKNLYNETISNSKSPSCASCHGSNGLGNESIGAPRLAGFHAEYVSIQLTNFKSQQRSNDDAGLMRAASEELTEVQIENLAYYISRMDQK